MVKQMTISFSLQRMWLLPHVELSLVFKVRCRFHVDARLFSCRSQITLEYGKHKKLAHEVQPSVLLLFLPHFYVICDLLLNRSMKTWNLFFDLKIFILC